MPGTNLPELHLRDLSGQDRNLGLEVGQTQFVARTGFTTLAARTACSPGWPI